MNAFYQKHMFGNITLPFVLLFQDVKFSLTLDVFDLCTPELQQKLVPMRDKFKIQEDKDVERIRVRFFLSLLSTLPS